MHSPVISTAAGYLMRKQTFTHSCQSLVKNDFCNPNLSNSRIKAQKVPFIFSCLNLKLYTIQKSHQLSKTAIWSSAAGSRKALESKIILTSSPDKQKGYQINNKAIKAVLALKYLQSRLIYTHVPEKTNGKFLFLNFSKHNTLTAILFEFIPFILNGFYLLSPVTKESNLI